MNSSLVILENVLQALTAGILIGSVYALMCVGLGLIFGVMRVINFAQGEFLMLGMYGTLYAYTWLALGRFLGPYVGPIVGAVLAAIVVYLVGILLHRYLLARVTGAKVAGSEGEGHYPQLILTLGLSLIISNAGLIFFGSTPENIRTPLSASAWEIGPLAADHVSVFLNKARSVAFLVSVGVAIALFFFITRTRIGKMLRAAADNPDAATYMGIDVERAHRIAFGLGCAITALAGGLVATYYPFQPYVGLEFVIIMYAGVVLGGMGSIGGAFWGGLTIGLVQQLSWNVFSGYSGLVSFGHASFFGLGAYTVTLLLVKLDITPWIGIPVGMVVGVAAGVLIGYPTFRLRGVYFALAMLAYPLALLYIFEWLGYQEVPLPMRREAPAAYMQFSDHRAYVVIALAMLIAALLVSLRIERSRFGLSLTAIKQNEWAAEASGINALRWKLKAIMVSGAIAAGAGGFYAVVLLIVTPSTVFGMLTSAQALIVTLFGGVATVWGPVVGSVILIPLAEILHAELGDKIPGINGVIFGAAIVLVVLVAPEGVLPKLRDALARRGDKGAARRAVVEPAAAAAVMPPRSPTSEVLLRVANLSRSFGGLRAVQDVSFEVRKGEVLGIIGPNGAGKTTLFNVLNGFIRPHAGEVLFEGQPLIGLKPSDVCALGIGRTFQVMRPFPRMSVMENVVVGAFVAERDDKRALAAAREALERVGLTAQADAIAGGLTTLELRLMELARAIASRPKLLLADETLAGLGSQEIDTLLARLAALAGNGLTIVIIEHTMRAMVRLADRLLVLDHGAVIAEGRPQEVTRDAKVIEAYLGKRWLARAAH